MIREKMKVNKPDVTLALVEFCLLRDKPQAKINKEKMPEQRGERLIFLRWSRKDSFRMRVLILLIFTRAETRKALSI